MSSSKAILETVQQRQGAAVEKKKTSRQRARRAAGDVGGQHEVIRNTAAANESARQLDSKSDVQRDNPPSTWKRSTALDAPDPRPGFVQRWVRIKANGQDDHENYISRYEEGWRARDPKTVPRAHLLTTTKTIDNVQMFVKRGHVLMELTEAAAKQRKEFYQGALDRQTKAVENDLWNDNKGAAGRVMPIRDATITSRATLARRRPRSAAADE